eukprot:m.90606 g.90606  ORF g.90606 m.90606 type:complete len:100 (+) comp12918_c0_seq3:117-416(+)
MACANVLVFFESHLRFVPRKGVINLHAHKLMSFCHCSCVHVCLCVCLCVCGFEFLWYFSPSQNESLVVMEDDGSGWALVRNASMQQGYVPSTYINQSAA